MHSRTDRLSGEGQAVNSGWGEARGRVVGDGRAALPRDAAAERDSPGRHLRRLRVLDEGADVEVFQVVFGIVDDLMPALGRQVD